ncbi:MAG: hypothetical protein SVR81_04255 [Chloroflexota bacterium]|nr:hypothetical protein [Chloroflexota bacterium]
MNLLAFRPEDWKKTLFFTERQLTQFQPTIVVLVPITSFINIGSILQMDYAKNPYLLSNTEGWTIREESIAKEIL